MDRQSWQRVLASLAFALFGLAANAQQVTYRFSPVNQWDINKTASYWNPILQYVSQKSGVPLELKIGRTSADTTAYVLAQEVEFVFSNHLFTPERMKLGWSVFGRRAGAPIQAQIVVPKDSGITKLEQLRDQEIGFAGPEATVGYKMPTAHLMSAAIATKPVFAGNQNAAFTQLFAGRVRAVGSNSMLVDGYAEREGKEFRVLWSSDKFHDLALMASGRVPESKVKAVAAAFYGMHNDPIGRQTLESASRHVSLTVDDHFVPATVADYGAYVKFFQSAPPSLR